MKLSRHISGIALAALALSACESVGPNGAEEAALDEDVATVVADAVLDDINQMSFVVPNSNASVSGAVPLAERHRVLTFFDVEGNPQDAFNPETTASVRIQLEMSGAVERDTWSATIERSRDLTVSGLEGRETSRTWNGTGESLVTGSRYGEDGVRAREMSMMSAIENVVRGLPREENPYPLSGTITRTVTVTWTVGDVTETRTRTATLAFNGTQFATLTVGDAVFEVDLAAREGDRAHHRR